MDNTFRFKQDLKVSVNGNTLAVARADLLDRSDALNSLIVTGDPGCGKTTLMLDICASKNNYKLIPVSHLSGLDELFDQLKGVSCEEYVLVDGIEDIDCSPKDIAKILSFLKKSSVCFALSVREYLWDKVSFLVDLEYFTVCKIMPLSEAQVFDYLEHNSVDIGHTLNLKFFRNPFYLSLLVGNGDMSVFDNVCQFMDKVIENQIRNVCLNLDLDIVRLLIFVESLAMKMRSNGVKSVHYDIVLELLQRHNLSEDCVGNISILEKSGHLYKFSHELFLDFLVAKIIYKSLFLDMNLHTYSDFQTSYQEDKFISMFVGSCCSLKTKLVSSLNGITDPVLKVNVLGMLAKIEGYDTEHIWHELMLNQAVYTLYREAVFARINTTDSQNPNEVDMKREISLGDDPIAVLICQRESGYACN